MDNQAKRVQIWPGVTPWAVTEVLENYVLASKAPDLQHAFKPVLSFTKDSFKAVPTIAYLTQFNSLLQDCIALAKNGKMSHVTIMRALSKLLELHPSWLGTASKTLLFPAVSQGVRVLLTWCRDLKKDPSKMQRTLKSMAAQHKPGLELIIDSMVEPKDAEGNVVKEEVDSGGEGGGEELAVVPLPEAPSQPQPAQLVVQVSVVPPNWQGWMFHWQDHDTLMRPAGRSHGPAPMGVQPAPMGVQPAPMAAMPASQVMDAEVAAPTMAQEPGDQAAPDDGDAAAALPQVDSILDGLQNAENVQPLPAQARAIANQAKEAKSKGKAKAKAKSKAKAKGKAAAKAKAKAACKPKAKAKELPMAKACAIPKRSARKKKPLNSNDIYSKAYRDCLKTGASNEVAKATGREAVRIWRANA